MSWVWPTSGPQSSPRQHRVQARRSWGPHEYRSKPRGQPPPQSPAAVVTVILSTRKSVPSRFLVSSVCMEKASNKLGVFKRKERKEKKGHGLVAALGQVLCQLSLTHKNKAPAAASSNEVQRVISRNIYCSRISNLERNPYRKIFFLYRINQVPPGCKQR